MDEHIPAAVVVGLRSRGADVLTAREDAHDGRPDPILLQRATALGRALVSFDVDFLREAAVCAAAGQTFCGIIHANPNSQ